MSKRIVLTWGTVPLFVLPDSLVLKLQAQRIIKLVFFLSIIFSSFAALAQEPAWWTKQKKDCNLSSTLAYNTWVAQGSPCNRGEGTPSNNTRITRKQQRLDEKQQRLNEAYEANEQGNKYFDKQDYANAIAFFQEALNKDPDDDVYLNNLITARHQLQIQQQAQLWDQQQAQLRIQQQQQEQQNKAAVLKMQQSVQAFTQTLNKVPSTGGLDFDGKIADPSANKTDNANGLAFIPAGSTPGQTTTAAGLQFEDPNVVNIQKLPSGLPKATDDAIAGAYRNAPPGVSDRVRKGFQAVMTKDWKVARAWFQDALLLDPGNQGLQKFIALCDYTPGNKPTANTPNNKQPAVVPGPNTPSKVEIDDFFNNFNAGVAFTPSEKVRTYVLSMPKEEFKKQLDLHFTIKQINELMFQNILLDIENDMQSQKDKIPK